MLLIVDLKTNIGMMYTQENVLFANEKEVKLEENLYK